MTTSLVQVEYRIEQLGHIGAMRLGGLAVKAEGLLGEIGDALPFPFSHGDVAQSVFIEVTEITQEVKQVGNGLERIIDLVSNGGGKAAGRDQFFGLAEHIVAAFALADVLDDHAGPAHLVWRGANGISAPQPSPGLTRIPADTFEF